MRCRFSYIPYHCVRATLMGRNTVKQHRSRYNEYRYHAGMDRSSKAHVVQTKFCPLTNFAAHNFTGRPRSIPIIEPNYIAQQGQLDVHAGPITPVTSNPKKTLSRDIKVAGVHLHLPMVLAIFKHPGARASFPRDVPSIGVWIY